MLDVLPVGRGPPGLSSPKATLLVDVAVHDHRLVAVLAEAAGEPVSREKFLDVVWGYAAFPTTRTVDTHIGSMRAKLEKNPESPRWLKTVHGVGYRLET